MDILKLQKEYDWVVTVLNSCENLQQINSSENLFKNFIHKWIDELSEEKTLTLNWNFKKHVSQKKLLLSTPKS
jgi:hypothetical protein